MILLRPPPCVALECILWFVPPAASQRSVCPSCGGGVECHPLSFRQSIGRFGSGSAPTTQLALFSAGFARVIVLCCVCYSNWQFVFVLKRIHVLIKFVCVCMCTPLLWSTMIFRWSSAEQHARGNVYVRGAPALHAPGIVHRTDGGPHGGRGDHAGSGPCTARCPNGTVTRGPFAPFQKEEVCVSIFLLQLLFYFVFI